MYDRTSRQLWSSIQSLSEILDPKSIQTFRSEPNPVGTRGGDVNALSRTINDNTSQNPSQWHVPSLRIGWRHYHDHAKVPPQLIDDRVHYIHSSLLFQMRVAR